MTAATRLHLEDGRLIAERVQDCTSIAEHCGRLRAETEQRGEMRLAARIPDVIVERYINDRGITFAEFLRDPAHARALLNDPALAAFRVWEGSV